LVVCHKLVLLTVSLSLGVFATHPIQYYVPWFRALEDEFDLQVLYAYRQDAEGQANAGFDVAFEWDVPLLEGYSYMWLENESSDPSLRSFWGCDTPQVRDVIGERTFDAFLCLGWNKKCFLQAAHACIRNGVSLLFQGDSQLRTPRSLLTRAAKYLPYRVLLPQASAHLYVGERNRRYLRHYGVPDDRLCFSPRFVDNEFFRGRGHQAEENGRATEIRDKFSIPSSAFVTAFVGKFIPKKRVSDLIAAYRYLDTDRADSHHLLLIGDGPLRTKLEDEVSRGDLEDRIHFAGFQNQKKLPAFYRAADSIVLPSDGRETWGLVVNEGMACGRPAIVSDAVGCAPDLVETAETGYQFEMGNPEALAGATRALKRQWRSRREPMQEAIRERIDQYSIRKATEGLRTAVQDLA
jgi:glycosyltransferase involved in cell wall biosynthesis